MKIKSILIITAIGVISCLQVKSQLVLNVRKSNGLEGIPYISYNSEQMLFKSGMGAGYAMQMAIDARSNMANLADEKLRDNAKKESQQKKIEEMRTQIQRRQEALTLLGRDPNTDEELNTMKKELAEYEAGGRPSIKRTSKTK